MNYDVYISYASLDKEIADAVCNLLESQGVKCWIAPRDVLPGEEWGRSILKAISSSSLFLLIFSSHSNSSMNVRREIENAIEKSIPVLPYLIERNEPSGEMAFIMSKTHIFDGTVSTLTDHGRQLVDVVKKVLPPRTSEVTEAVKHTQQTSKGYVFISYVQTDRDFVEKLCGVLKNKRYGYWDYVMGNRDYHGYLYKELEERIDDAVAFVTVVSDQWRDSDWVASEFIYAKESKKPVFVIQAKRLQKPLPLLLNLQTRINMAEDFEKGSQVLIAELEKEGL